MSHTETLNPFDHPNTAKALALFKLGICVNLLLAGVYFIGFFISPYNSKIFILMNFLLVPLILWLIKSKRRIIGDIGYKQRRLMIKPYKMRAKWYLFSLIFVIVIPLFIRSFFTLSTHQMAFLIGSVFFLNNGVLTLFYLKNPRKFI